MRESTICLNGNLEIGKCNEMGKIHFNIEKFIYLQDQLSGSARDLIESVEVQQLSYEEAKSLLLEAFDDKIASKHNVLKII